MTFQIATVEGKEFVSLNGHSVLDSALNSGLAFEYSCKNGQCGVCKTTLLTGQVKALQPQVSLTEQDIAENKILTCCCSALSDLLIDSEDLSALHGIKTKTFPARINGIKFLSNQIVEVKLRLPPTAQFKFLEGQYIDVIHSAVTRSYSIASTSEEPELSLLIKKVEQGVLSRYWFEEAAFNDLLRIEGPKGTFFLRDKNKPLVFLATGTGIAPVLAILNQLEQDDTFHQLNSIQLFWGNRRSEDFVWISNFKKIQVDVFFVHSRPPENWEGERGYVQDVALKKIVNIKEAHVYACGSNNMIYSAKKAFTEKGLVVKNFYSDAFVQSY